jgi:uncharacterized protein YaeQ
LALKSTIFKAQVSISDMDRGYYAEHALTIARHPSETDERMMVRLLAFVLFANERLEFGKGLSSADEPDLALTDYTGQTLLWVEVGLPDTRTVKRALSQAREVVVLAYGAQAARMWLDREGPVLRTLAGLRVLLITPDESVALAALCQRSMQLQFTIQDGDIWLTSDGESLHLHPETQLNSPRT